MQISKQEISAGYDQITEKIGQSEDFYRRCLSLVPKIQGKILDAGCGRGLLLKKIYQKSKGDVELFGIDISQKLCDISKENNPYANIVKGDVESLPYTDDSFDIVFMTETLEHLLDYDKSIKEISRVLKVNGVFIVTVPNRDWLRYDFYNKNRKKFQPVDDHYFSFKEVSNLLLSNNFKIEKYIGSDNLYYYDPIHKYERVLAVIFPFLHKKMKRLMFRCINSKNG